MTAPKTVQNLLRPVIGLLAKGYSLNKKQVALPRKEVVTYVRAPRATLAPALVQPQFKKLLSVYTRYHCHLSYIVHHAHLQNSRASFRLEKKSKFALNAVLGSAGCKMHQ